MPGKFNNCEYITCDDDLIQNIALLIASVDKIQSISYQMDKLDTMTVTDTKYIFYDIDMNEFPQPAKLFYDVVNFLNLIYDIAIGPAAEENDINVIMRTTNSPSFNITVSNLFSTGIWSTPDLILYSLAQTEGSDFRVYFNYDKIDAKIVLKQPYKPLQLIHIGSAVLT